MIALVYLGVLLLTSAAQEWLLFPGQRTQGKASSVVTPRSGESLWRIVTADGTPVVALFQPARRADGSADPDARSRPTMVFFYGNGMCAADARGFGDWFTKELGVNFVVPDYPGFGMSGGSPSAAACDAMADALLARALADPAIDPARMVPAGLSLGSGVAAGLAARMHDAGRPAAGVMVFSGYTTMAEVARRMVPWLPVDAMLRHRFDCATPLRRVTAPTFLAHGWNDELIPFSMHGALVEVAAGPVTEVVNGSGHNDFFETKPAATIAAMRAFLDGLSPAAVPPVATTDAARTSVGPTGPTSTGPS